MLDTRNAKGRGLVMSEKITSLLAACAVTLAVFSATAPAMAKSSPIVVTATTTDAPVRHIS